MKTNFFKIVLPAFALMLAITASLAFTSTNDEDITQKQGYEQVLDGSEQITQCKISIMCQTDVSSTTCQVDLSSPELFGLEIPNQIPQLSCEQVLYKIGS